MGLPDITHLQFLVLNLLMDEERSGRWLREQLAEHGHKKSGPAFYQFMSRLEDAKFVKGHYEPKEVDGQPVRERVYRVMAGGISAWEDVRAFYAPKLGLEGV
jgi:DNA-binding PadR family transcriptional regulator